jgi:ribonuclease P protein component
VGSAVDRNRVRRRLRAAVSACADELVAGGAYLFEAERSVLTVGFTELRSSVRLLISRASGGRA